MRTFIFVAAILFQPLAGMAADPICLERIECWNHSSGFSRFTLAHPSEHEASKNIPNKVYVRVAYWQGSTRSTSTNPDSVWSQSVDSDYSMALISTHLESLRRNYSKALRNCENKIADIKFEYPMCKN